MDLIIIPLILLFTGLALVLENLSLDAIRNLARSWWGTGTIVILDPACEAELERIANKKCTKRYRRYVYNKSTGARKLVESDSIASDLAYQSRVETYVS